MTENQKEAESCVAQNATTRSENTHSLSDSKAGILKLAFEPKKRGYCPRAPEFFG
jgi:hypothetical protein